MRVLIVDDQPVVADALAARLAVEEEVGQVATETDPHRVLPTVDRLRPDVVVWDVQLGDEDGLGLLRLTQERLPQIRAVVVTAHDDPKVALAAVRAGAVGFVSKGAPAAEFVRAVVGAARGESHINPRILFRMMPLLRMPLEPTLMDERLRRLSPREIEVLQHMLAGASRSTIANDLFISVNTVRTHAKNILAKMEVHTTLEAVRVAFEAGLEPSAAGTRASASDESPALRANVEPPSG